MTAPQQAAELVKGARHEVDELDGAIESHSRVLKIVKREGGAYGFFSVCPCRPVARLEGKQCVVRHHPIFKRN